VIDQVATVAPPGPPSLRKKHRVFHSFDFEHDAHRAVQLGAMAVVEAQRLLTPVEWDDLWRRGDAAVEAWTVGQMWGRSCVVVLIGSTTARCKRVEYEIRKGWAAGKGVVGVHVHDLEDASGSQSPKGASPFGGLELGRGTSFAKVARAYDPPYSTSADVYRYVEANLAGWVDEALAIRGRFAL
jgi:hypothetical protein